MRRSHPKAQSGFTLIETLVALGIMSLIMAGVMDLFIGSMRMATRTNAEVFASLDASRAIRHVIDETREGLWFALPSDVNHASTSPAALSDINTFLDGTYFYFGPTYTSVTPFQSTDGLGDTVDTAMLIMTPAAATPVSVDLSSGSSPSAVSYPTTSNPSFYDRNGYGGGIIIYRADYGGTPDGPNGTYLYETPVGGTLAQAKEIIPLCEHVPGNPSVTQGPAPAWNAVQFVRPTDTTGTVTLPYEVEIKIISTYYSPIEEHQTDEATNTLMDTALTGKCVFMRNHELTTQHVNGGTIVSASAAGNRFNSSY